MSSNFKLYRRKTTAVSAGKIIIGGQNPIALQSMTNTDTLNLQATAEQCISAPIKTSKLSSI